MKTGARYFASRYWAPRYWSKTGAALSSGLAMAVLAEFSPGVWTNVTSDTMQVDRVRIKYGIDGSGPLDCMASTGECDFALQNWAKGGRAQGAYSPLHANVTSGWTYGTAIRVVITHNGVPYTKHRGKARVIDPSAGLYRDRRVRVVSYDGIRDLMEADVRQLGIQSGKTETELITAVLDATPAAAQPVARMFDAGVDTFTYAFHDLGSGGKAAGIIRDILVDSHALGVMKGDGTFVVRNRHQRVAGTSNYAFNNTMHGFVGPSDLNQAYNLVRMTIHPLTPDAVPTTILYSDQSVRSVAAGTTVPFWVSYRDPAESRTLIGGLDVVTPLVSGTDYAGNSQADGLGTDLSSYLTITTTAFGSTALISIQNTHPSSTIYLVNGSGQAFLTIRGRGVYDLGPQTYQATSTQPYGVRELPVSLRYQDNPLIAQSYAEYLETQYNALGRQPQQIEFLANSSDDFMLQALAREPGDLITVTEPMTGFTAVEAVIQSVELDISAGPIIICRWGLAPSTPYKSWKLGVSGRTALGSGQTILGF